LVGAKILDAFRRLERPADGVQLLKSYLSTYPTLDLLDLTQVGGMFGLFFTSKKDISSYDDVMACDVERFRRFFHLMLEEGVYLAPSAFEAGFISSAHSEADIQATLDAAERVFARLS